MSAEIVKFPKKARRSENGTSVAALPPATVTELPRAPRRSLLTEEFKAKLDQLDPLGRKYFEGYMQALLDQRGLR